MWISSCWAWLGGQLESGQVGLALCLVGLACAAALARAGLSVLFFAEGTFTRIPGLLPFHMGAFVTAAEADVPDRPAGDADSTQMLSEDDVRAALEACDRPLVKLDAGDAATLPNGSRASNAECLQMPCTTREVPSSTLQKPVECSSIFPRMPSDSFRQ